jgi:hypothetical protein
MVFLARHCVLILMPPRLLPDGWLAVGRLPVGTRTDESVALEEGGVGEKPFEGFAPTGPASKNPYSTRAKSPNCQNILANKCLGVGSATPRTLNF